MVTTKLPPCFPPETLAEFATGRVSTDQLDIISAHVDTCVSCQATVAELAEDPDSFVAALQDLPRQEAEPVDESACQLVLDRLVEHRSLSGRLPVAAASIPASIGAYRVLEPIAAGGMGIVYKAHHPKLKRTVAIKLLPLQQWAGSAAVARFEREMEVIGGLDHPNVVRASDAGDADGLHYLVMDFIDGLDLSRLVHRMGPLPMADACEIIRQTACGLEHVHATSLVHRDIKPSNIMVTQDGHVKILDLGLAMLGQQYREVENNLTTIGQLMGTLDYMAPEQAADSRLVDSRADIYSLGATLFKLLTGQAPYGGPSHRSLLKKVLALADAPVPSLREFRPELPEELDDIVGRCLAKDPDSRFAHVNEVTEALARFAASHNLPSLMQEARARASRDPVDTSAWPLPGAGAVAATPHGTKPAKLQAARRRTNWFVRALIATAAVACIALGAVIIRIATDRGELIVRSPDPNARILITRIDNQSVQEMTVEQGAGKITIKSGQYAVELLSDADRWSLDRNQFTISRGDQVVLQVEQKQAAAQAGRADSMGAGQVAKMAGGTMSGSTGMMPGLSAGGAAEMGSGGSSGPMGGSGMAEMGSGSVGGMAAPSGSASAGDLGTMGSSMGMPDNSVSSTGGSMLPGGETWLVYDGKTYHQWLQIVDTERSPTRLLEAVNAIGVLATPDNSEQAAAALLRIMRAFGSMTINDDSPRCNLIKQTLETLSSLNTEGVVKAFAKEVSEGNGRSRAFLLRLLGKYQREMDAGTGQNRLATVFAAAAPQIMSKLLEISRDANVDVSRWALQCAGTLAVGVGVVEVSTFDGFLPRFREALTSTDQLTAYHAAVAISHFAPNTPGIAEVLLSFKGKGDQYRDAVPSLCRLGPHAAVVAPQLVEMLGEQLSLGERIEREGGVARDIARTLQQIGPAAIPGLQKLVEPENGLLESRPNSRKEVQQLIEAIQAAATKPADATGQPPLDSRQ